jgi:uncharacterized protein YjbI with pentapeptide repeats
MPNPDHIAQLMKGVATWNAWRDENPTALPELDGANLDGADLRGANLNDLADAIVVDMRPCHFCHGDGE